jgi:hypothetical protein
MKTRTSIICASLVAFALSPAHAAPNKPHQAWTDPATALREDPDFAIQGEYRSDGAAAAMGVQIVALGEGKFDAYILKGGLPGAGWEPGMKREILHGKREEGKVVFRANDDGSPAATIEDGVLAFHGGTRLSRVERASATLGAKPPEGATVLFDGTSAEHWENGRVEGGHLQAIGCTSKERFADYKLHLEFRTPYMPDARGQARGNSGIYHSGRWETQILDSFGLDASPGDCGGIYSIAKPRLNMCLPPLAWQTYDVEFTAAKFDASGARTAWPRITVRLNGELVHENLELPKDFTPAAPITQPLKDPTGPVFLQDHGNPVVFRNIWVVPGGSSGQAPE